MSNHIPTITEIEDKLEALEETILERRIRILQASLVSHNATSQAVLDACTRITAVWNAPATTKANGETNDDEVQS